jgi:RNA polymerase sigma factor (sigma-70 family)
VRLESGPQEAGSPRHLSAGELNRFNQCVLPYLDAAHNLARYLLRDADDAEDAVQDAFLRAIRHFDDFRGVDGRAWLLSIVRNTCLTRLRGRRSSASNVEFDEEIHTVEEARRGPEADLTRKDAAVSVHEVLGRLGVEFREVLVLRELEGLSYKEIAQITGVPIGTVMSRLARGRKQMMLALGPAVAKEND